MVVEQGVIVDDRLYNNEQTERLYQEIRDSLKPKRVSAPFSKPVLCSKVQNED